MGEEDKIGTHDMGDYLHLISVGKVGDEGDTQWGEDKVGEHNQCHLQVVLWVVVERNGSSPSSSLLSGVCITLYVVILST